MEELENIKAVKAPHEQEVWKQDKTFLVSLIAYFVVLLLFILVRVISGLGWLDNLNKGAVDIGFSFVSQVIIMLIVPLIAIKSFAKKNEDYGYKKALYDFGFNKPSGKVLGFSIVLGVLCYFFNIFVAGIFNAVLLLIGYRFPIVGESSFTGVTGLLISIVLVGVLPGVCEEANHRGMLLNSFTNKLGMRKAVLFSAIIFGLMHLNIVQAFYAMILGYIFALAVLSTRSIWTGVIMHFLNNAIGTYFTYASQNDWFLGQALNKIVTFIGSFGILFFAAAIFGLYYFIMAIIHKLARENYKKNEPQRLANFLQENPEYVKQRVEAGETISLEQMSQQVDHRIKTLSKRDAIRFYVDTQQKPVPMTALEKTFLIGIFFLGALTTVFTFIWGML